MRPAQLMRRSACRRRPLGRSFPWRGHYSTSITSSRLRHLTQASKPPEEGWAAQPTAFERSKRSRTALWFIPRPWSAERPAEAEREPLTGGGRRPAAAAAATAAARWPMRSSGGDGGRPPPS